MFIFSYSERKETVLAPLTGQSPASLRIFEECNFASNFAYYNLMYKTTSLVWMPEDAKKALGQASAGLALGSSFFHGSHTNLGQTLDNMMIKIIAFILYETYINKLQLPDQTPDIIMTLKQEARRERTGVQMAQGITDMYRNEPVENWNQILQALDVPRYEITFGAIIMTMSAHAKKSLMGSWTNTILLQILPMENTDKDFLKEFGPLITRALQDRAHYDIEEPDVFNKMTAGLKLMLAFVFQETVQPLNSLRSALTATGLKSINNFLTDFGTLGSIEGPPGRLNLPGYLHKISLNPSFHQAPVLRTTQERSGAATPPPTRCGTPSLPQGSLTSTSWWTSLSGSKWRGRTG